MFKFLKTKKKLQMTIKKKVLLKSQIKYVEKC